MPSIRANRTLDQRARFGLGTDTQDDDTVPATDETDLGVEAVVENEVDGFQTSAQVTTAIAAATATNNAALKVTSLDGADETTPPGEIYAVTGMAATAVIVAVLFISTKAAVATIEVLDPATFTPGAATLTSTTEVDRTDDQLIVIWFDV